MLGCLQEYRLEHALQQEAAVQASMHLSPPDQATRIDVRNSAAVVHEIAIAAAATWPALQESTKGIDTLGHNPVDTASRQVPW
jgi:hypothetical protein